MCNTNAISQANLRKRHGAQHLPSSTIIPADTETQKQGANPNQHKSLKHRQAPQPPLLLQLTLCKAMLLNQSYQTTRHVSNEIVWFPFWSGTPLCCTY